MQKLATRVLDQRADIRGNVTVTSRPALLPNWRIEPNLTGNVTIADGGMTVAGIKLNVSNEVKPLLDKTVNEQIGNLSNQLRNDRDAGDRGAQAVGDRCAARSRSARPPPARRTCGSRCRPTRAFAAQPRILADWVILTVGVQAETRIVPSETKPDCPFPARLDLVPRLDQGKVTLGVPIDVPFTELNRVMELQLKGKTFPETGNAPGQVTVLASSISASGDRLLISLRVKAKETKSWFGFGAEATVHVWGKPVLDQQNQIMRLTDISLDVQSEAAFGLLGAAARAAIPYLQKALADNAVVDLKPFAASALEEHRRLDRRIPEAGRRRRGRGLGHRPAPHRHRVRFEDLARDRRGRRHRARAGAQDRAAVNVSKHTFDKPAARWTSHGSSGTNRPSRRCRPRVFVRGSCGACKRAALD